jgi:micrococcal nuclease
MPTRTAIALAAILWIAGTLTAMADTLSGRVVDGDTVVVLDTDKVQHKIRMAGIDAAESGQDWGTRAKQHLSSLIGGKDVLVETQKQDKYGRTVGKIIADDQDVNLAMVRAGLAWWYKKYSREQSAPDRLLYEAAETAAREARVGLWADPNPIPPWDWRHGTQASPSAGRTGTGCPCATGAVRCTGTKGGKYCIATDGRKRYRH